MNNKSLAKQAVGLVPPLRRIYDALGGLEGRTRSIEAAQERSATHVDQLRAELTGLLSTTVTSLRARLEQLAAQTDTLRGEIEAKLAPAPVAPPVAETPIMERSALDDAARRELGEAALRHLPLLPGTMTVEDDAISFAGICGAPDNLTGNMAFFLNGQRIDDVDYPILDPELQSRFPHVPGMHFQFRARARENLEQRRSEPFWRLDASPTGTYVESDWRLAIHFRNPLTEQFPFPPVSNMKRVIGDTSTERFSMGGAMIFKNTERLLRELGHTWADFPEILDWGCGAGRLTRYLISDTDAAVTGIDIDADNVAWCARTYERGQFRTVPLRPPTGLDAGRYGLVFGLSVLTHLTESDQFAWLGELRRVTRPGALLLLSVQGPTQYAYNRFPPELYRQVQEQGYLDLQRDNALDEVIADKEYYRSAMQSRTYIAEKWGSFFDVVGFADAIAGLQDFVILRRPTGN